tara:strand:+ start:1095 stop:1421 length:327 start_codon:yes stop_codon:yes gene_type:complete
LCYYAYAVINRKSKTGDIMSITKKDYVTIHQAIHNDDKNVNINGKQYNIARRDNGLRSVKIPGFGTFIEQDPNVTSKYSKKAKEGDTITWLVKDVSWELIVNDEVINQ